MRPISVRMPVAVTIARAVPVGGGGAAEHHVVAIAERRVAVDRRGVLRHRAGSRRSARLRRSAAPPIRSRRASAGIVSPSSMRMTSPATTSAAGTLCRWPPRTTVASAADIARKRGDRGLGARLLQVAHRRVEQDDREDRDGFVGQRRVALDRPRGRRRSPSRPAAGRRGRPGTGRGSAATPGPAAPRPARCGRRARGVVAPRRRRGRAEGPCRARSPARRPIVDRLASWRSSAILDRGHGVCCQAQPSCCFASPPSSST